MAASRDPMMRLGHIRDEIAALTSALDGVTFEVFAANYVLRRTTEHAILIISEAIKARLPEMKPIIDRMIENETRARR